MAMVRRRRKRVWPNKPGQKRLCATLPPQYDVMIKDGARLNY
jgi:hypothetical protein